ncbi:hypothetical protein CHCC20335_3750 [Bacillus paralicheniformis]|nr:hypothetical protein CHCC20335_3750 [Bacillus paralicheniformis]
MRTCPGLAADVANIEAFIAENGFQCSRFSRKHDEPANFQRKRVRARTLLKTAVYTTYLLCLWAA